MHKSQSDLMHKVGKNCPSRKAKSWTKSSTQRKEAGRIKPKGNRDHRVTLNQQGREEHTRLFHGVEDGRPQRSRLWRSNRTGWLKANSKPGDVVTLTTEGDTK